MMLDPKRQLVVDKFCQALQVEERDENTLGIKSIVEFCEQLEAELFNGHTFKEYKTKVFTLNFNLSDKRNQSIRTRILDGKFSPSELARASSEELASEDLQAQRQEWRDKYYSTIVVQQEAVISDDQTAGKRVKVDIPTDPLMALEVAAEISEVLPTIAMPPTTPLREQEEQIHVGNITPSSSSKQTNEQPGEKDFSKLQVYTDQLKQKLNLLNHSPLRKGHIIFLDYLAKHCGQ